jgi:hypothetical protein
MTYDMKNALHRISLASQNSMSSKDECGRIARERHLQSRRQDEPRLHPRRLNNRRVLPAVLRRGRQLPPSRRQRQDGEFRVFQRAPLDREIDGFVLVRLA